jgi:hypothetical protein
MQNTRTASRQQGAISSRRHSRKHMAGVLGRIDRAHNGRVDRRSAREEGIPRTTVLYHQQRRRHIDAEWEMVAFFESEAGLGVLHRIVTGLHYVFSFIGAAGARLVAEFLRLTGLDKFVAASRESQREVAQAMETALCEFGDEQKEVLATSMVPKDINIAQDETFHPQTCLVAIEPVSGYILVEEYTQKRDAATWNQAMDKALQGLPVKVIQSTSDEAKGIRAHVKQSLGAHHSPDLFHVQYETSRGMSAPLAAQVRYAEKAVAEAAAAVEKCREQANRYEQTTHGPGRPPDFKARIADAIGQHKQAEKASQEAQASQERARRARRGLGEDYHLVDIGTGAWRSAKAVEKTLKSHFAALREVAMEANLPERAFTSIDKAERVLPGFTDTLVFVMTNIKRRLDVLPLAQEGRDYVHDVLIPQAYLRRAAGKAATAEKRSDILKVVAALDRAAPQQLLQMTDSAKEQVQRVVNECADLFQRASAGVEGRNGQLELRHHSLHKISAERLKALTVVHNFVIKRPDGTTAAQRFFGAKYPDDPFDWLLKRLPLPVRPRRGKAKSPQMDPTLERLRAV